MRLNSIARSLAGFAFSLLVVVSGSAGSAFAKTSPKLGVSPNQLKFGEQIVTLTSDPQPITLNNKSSSFAIPITSIRVKLPFVKVSTTCGPGIAAGSSCEVMIAFHPTVAEWCDTKRA